MLQASPHAYHFKRIFSFGEGHRWPGDPRGKSPRRILTRQHSVTLQFMPGGRRRIKKQSEESIAFARTKTNYPVQLSSRSTNCRNSASASTWFLDFPSSNFFFTPPRLR